MVARFSPSRTLTAPMPQLPIRSIPPAHKVCPHVPACMSAAEHAFWASDTDPLIKVDSPCRDCTIGFYLARLAEGRCNGTPGEPETGRPARSVNPHNVRRRKRTEVMDLRNHASYDSR